MSKDPDEDFEYVRRAFACGSHHHEFKAAYDSADQDSKARLARVAWRISSTLTLRYRQDLITHRVFGFHDQWRAQNEWKALELYLLVTCLDTLAGQPTFKPFDEWLRDQSVEITNLEIVTDLYEEYQDLFGVRRNLKRLFLGLPDSAKEWITQVLTYTTRRDYHSQTRGASENVERQIIRMFSRFFRYRNTYTHSSAADPPVVSQNIPLDPTRGQWAEYWPAVLDENGKKMYLYARDGVDEATILRIILVVVAWQLLQLDPTRDVIVRNMRKYSRLDALFGLVYELARSANYVREWLGEEKEQHFWIFLWRGVPRVTTTYAKAILERLEDNPFETGFRSWIQNYLSLAEELNRRIVDFNESHPPFDDRVSDGSYDDLQALRFPEIEMFLESNRELIDQIIQHAFSTEYDNLWLIIRDPCYT